MEEAVIVLAAALLFFTVVGAIGLTVEAQTADVLDAGYEQLVGGSCGTVSPDSRDECCMRQNEGKPQIRCVGYWDYLEESGECRFICGFKSG